MTAQQRIDHRQIYNQLRLSLAFPGEAIADTRKPYAPVNRDALSWDELMLTPDPPAVAQHRRHEIGMRFMLGAA